MSRTFKDRPYMVRLNDVTTEGRYIDHQHAHAGEPVTRYVNALDEFGEPAFRETEYIQATGYTVVDDEGNRFFVKDHDEASRYSIRVIHQKKCISYSPIHEFVIVGYRPTECTADLPVKSMHDVWGRSSTTHLCAPHLSYKGYWYGRNRPQTDAKRAYHASARHAEKQALKRAQKAYNYNDDDLLGEELEKSFTRQQRHIGWWN